MRMPYSVSRMRYRDSPPTLSISPGKSRGLRYESSRAIGSPSAVRARRMWKTSSEGLTRSFAPRRAPAGMVSVTRTEEPGSRPRVRMSSLNEVSSTDLVIRGAATNVPAPCTR